MAAKLDKSRDYPHLLLSDVEFLMGETSKILQVMSHEQARSTLRFAGVSMGTAQKAMALHMMVMRIFLEGVSAQMQFFTRRFSGFCNTDDTQQEVPQNSSSKPMNTFREVAEVAVEVQSDYQNVVSEFVQRSSARTLSGFKAMIGTGVTLLPFAAELARFSSNRMFQSFPMFNAWTPLLEQQEKIFKEAILTQHGALCSLSSVGPV